MYLKAQSSGHHRLTRSPPSCGVWDTRKEGRKIKCVFFFSSCKFDANFTFLSFFLSFFFFFLLRMHWFRKTPWHVVSAGSIRRSQLAFSWSSAYLSRPCHASRCFINISKNRRRPVFFLLVTEACEVVCENYKPNWMLYWCIDKGGVYRLAYSTIRFLFFSFSFSSWQLQRTGWEGALMTYAAKVLACAYPPTRHVVRYSFLPHVHGGRRA